jgi:diaminopimelate epimerase
MNISFYKYQGTGNDFVMIDNRIDCFPKNDIEFVKKLCDRRFGIGADGLILLEEHPSLDFRMVYYNADGNLSSMCGNGGRCIVKFAKQLGIIGDFTKFEAVDGFHEATIIDGQVLLRMNDVKNIIISENYTFLNTGSPHHVELVENLKEFDVKINGALIRQTTYGAEGANVNFVEQTGEDIFSVRTYERGVEDETLSCGTGATAAAIAMNILGKTNATTINLNVEGGKLIVSFEKNESIFTKVTLKGPAQLVFKGSIAI